MSALKKIGIILGSGGIIAIGYYFLNKRKPSIAEQQLSQLKTDTTTLAEEKLVSVEDKLIQDKCYGLRVGEYEKCVEGIKNSTQGTLANIPSTNSSTITNPRNFIATPSTNQTAHSGGLRQ